MLSRLAESLYWIGRYIERADDTARIVDSYVHRMVEDPLNNEDAACRSLLSILGLEVREDEQRTVENTLEVIVYDDENPSAISGALRGAFENARRSRDHISSEMWVCLNTTQLRLPHTEMNARQLGPATYLQYVRERAALFTGLTETTLSRDDGWQFLMLGRSIERIDMTARLLTARLVGADHAPTGWPSFGRVGPWRPSCAARVRRTSPTRSRPFSCWTDSFPVRSCRLSIPRTRVS